MHRAGFSPISGDKAYIFGENARLHQSHHWERIEKVLTQKHKKKKLLYKIL